MNKLHGFFEALADACQYFRHSIADMPGANCKGCRVTVGTKPHQRGKVVFQFVAKNEKIVSVKLDMQEMQRNPEEYINALLEKLNDRHLDMTKESIIFIPKKRFLTSEVQRVSH